MKIKKVEIQAFKSYLLREDGTFDFTRLDDSSLVANFTSIYAPNGFGKTSFYDALDYCITNNISRYIRSKVQGMNQKEAKTHNNKGEKQYILRNRIADKKEKECELKIDTEIKILTTTDTIISKYKAPRNGSMDYKFDPNESNPDSDYFESVLLSQEAIDSFLRESNPADRYNKFVKYSQNHELATANDNRTIISSMLRDIDNEIEVHTKKIKKTHAEIEKTIIPINVFEDASSVINLLNINNLNFDFDTFTTEFTAEDKLSLNSKVTLAKSELQQQCANHNSTIATLNQFILNSEKLQRDHLAKAQLNNDIKQLVHVITDKRDILKLHDRLKKNQNTVADTHSFIKQLQDYVSQAPLLVELNTKLAKVTHEQSQSQEKIALLTSTATSTDINLKSRRAELQKWMYEAHLLTNFGLEAPDYYQQIAQFEQQIPQLKQKINDQIAKQKIDEAAISRLELELSQIRLFDITIPVISGFDPLLQIKLNTPCEQYLAADSRLIELNSQKNTLKNNLNNTQLQSKAIAALIEQASTIITTSRSSNCPLCNQTYQDMAELQETIAKNPALSDAEKKYTTELNELSNAIASLQETINGIKSTYNNICIDEESKIDLNLKVLKIALQTSIDLQKTLTTSADSALAQLTKLKVKTLSKSESELTAHIEQRIQLYHEKIESLAADIAINEKSKADTAHQLAKCQHEFEQVAADKTKYLAQASFTALQKLLADNHIKEDVESIMNWLTNSIEAQQQKITKENSAISEVDNSIKRLLQAIPTEFHDLDIERLELSKSELDVKLEKLNNQIATFQGVFELLNIEPDEIKDKWNSAVVTANNKLAGLKDKISLLDQQQVNLNLLMALADNMVNLGNKTALQKQLDEANQELQILDSIKAPLKQDLKQISHQIEQSIEQYFHTGLINQLYQAIEPHPDYKEVEFDCKIPESGESPQLHVKVKNGDDGSMIAPSIDFSSAQINILSLSIFLARALNTKSKKGEPIDCIFIDDPIQSMDSINVLGLIDLFRNISYRLDKQLIISTHDENFHELLKKKIPTDVFGAKYLKLSTFGKVVIDES